MRKCVIFLGVVILALAQASFGDPCPKRLDWSAAERIAPGVDYIKLEIDKPRLMANYIMRVNLSEKGIRVTGTHRAPEWGRPMDDYTNKVTLIDTRREKTLDFLKRHRANGTNMVAAINTAAWIPWEAPFTHKFGSFVYFTVSDGQVISHSKKQAPMLVIGTNNIARISDKIDDALVPCVAIAHPAWLGGIIMRDGKYVSAPNASGPSLAPRTALGVSADGHYLYALIVDGRQKGYSLGADMKDLAAILRAAGASDAVNMDGGGSATLTLWDAKTQKPAIVNRHDKKRRKYRKVAANLGIYFEK